MNQLDFDICARKHGGADTSVEAFESTPAEIRGKQSAAVYALLRSAPATTEEVSQRLGIRYTAASARMSELKRDGLIRDSGQRRPTSTGRNARIMEAV